ncbi:hypothetical protein D3C81_2268640 [compost metagenome]
MTGKIEDNYVHGNTVNLAQISRDGSTVITADYKGNVRLWNRENLRVDELIAKARRLLGKR